MPEKSMVTWNTMISGYIENGKAEDGMKLVKKMMVSGIKHVVKSPLYLDMTVGTSLISMYSKCGVLEDALKLFLEMPRKDVVTWNAMISGFGSISVFNILSKCRMIMELSQNQTTILIRDRLHPDLESIRMKLKDLEKKMKLAGYVPDLDSSLHDVGEEQKEQLLLWHSEKPAIAST
ncbi:hypothetical protein HAX54_009502 [Datura stramonium]|uniref:DYW domain-containing protein n=1 Tax=Datura stramonium TaxID=4076 RepID=A0ABS8TGR7_DATST|nr:hypothetical protein [Datura stramonium]